MSKTGMLDMLQSDSRSPKRFRTERAELKHGGRKFFWQKPEPPRPRRKSKGRKRR